MKITEIIPIPATTPEKIGEPLLVAGSATGADIETPIMSDEIVQFSTDEGLARVQIIKPLKDGPFLNRTALALKGSYQVKVGIPLDDHVLTHRGSYVADQKLLIVRDLELAPLVISHETAHLQLGERRARGETTVFAGSFSNQSLEEFYTHPLHIRLAQGSQRLKFAETFQTTIVGRPLHAIRQAWAQLPRSSLYFDGVHVSKGYAPVMFFEKDSGGNYQSVSLDVVRVEGRQFLRATVHAGSQTLEMHFSTLDAEGEWSRLRELRKADPEQFHNSPEWQIFYRLVGIRIERVSKMREDVESLNDRLIRTMRGGGTGDAEASALINYAIHEASRIERFSCPRVLEGAG